MVELILLTINHQSLVATKANRMVRAAGDKLIMEFGSRRAQGYDAAILGARATYIGGCGATACAITDRDYGVPAVGTMAHSWVQMFDSEYEAFRSYAEIYPDDCTLLIDTYNVLKSGIPNAIKVFDEVVVPKGYRPKGVRIDSGDIAYLSKKARKMLDAAGYSDVKIVASNSLDEYIIRDLSSLLFLYTILFQKFFGQFQICFCSPGILVEVDCRHTKTWCFGQTNISWNHCFVHLIWKMASYFLFHLFGQFQSAVIHGKQNSFQLNHRIVQAFHLFDRCHQLGQTFQRVVFTLNWNNNTVTGRKSIQCHQSHRRWTVDRSQSQGYRGSCADARALPCTAQ